MTHTKFVVPTVATVLAILGFLIWRGIGDNTIFYLTPSEAVARRTEFGNGERFRIGGLVQAGTVEKEGDDYRFEMTDGGATIPILLTSTPPQLFSEDLQVLVEGAWRDETFVADLLLVKHDETYRTPEGQPYQPPA